MLFDVSSISRCGLLDGQMLCINIRKSDFVQQISEPIQGGGVSFYLFGRDVFIRAHGSSCTSDSDIRRYHYFVRLHI